MKAMVLAAGLGRRLRPLTENCAKPALPFIRKTIMARAIDFLAKNGVGEIAVNLYYLPKTIKKALRNAEWGRRNAECKIKFFSEKILLGTGGGLKNAKNFFKNEENFLLVNGDCIYEGIDIKSALSRHSARSALATLITKSASAEHTPVWVSKKDRRVMAIGGKKPSSEATERTFIGVHILSRRIFDFFPNRKIFDIVSDVYIPLIKNGEAIFAYRAKAGLWSDCGTSERFLKAVLRFARYKKLPKVAVHPSAKIGKNVKFKGICVIEKNVVIGDNCVIENAVVMDGAKIKRGTFLKNAVVPPRV